MSIKYVKKRDGQQVPFNSEKIKNAVLKAADAVAMKNDVVGEEITQEVISYLNIFYKDDKNGIPDVEQIQDLVEKVLIEKGYAEVAKAYILYREQHSKLRDARKLFNDAIDVMNDYLDLNDWKVNENSNMGYSLQGLNNFIASEVTAQYWLQEIYTDEIRERHMSGDFHIHDLGNLSVYCCGWDLEQFLLMGFKGVPTKIESSPPKHLKSALGQIVNFFFTLQGEAAGAMAFSNFDTYLAPFIAYDNLDYEEVKQAMQEFLFNMNVPTRVGFQTPFTNITMDLSVPEFLAEQPVIIGGELQNRVYGEFQEEMDIFNRVFAELMIAGDAKGRMFSFPIPTYNITKDFEWDNPVLDPVWEMTAKFGIPYFSNFVNSDMNPEDARSMCLFPEEDILIKENGTIKKLTIGELFADKKDKALDDEWFDLKNSIEALSLNSETGKLEWAKIKRLLQVTDKKIINIKTDDGKTMKVSPDHLVGVFTEDGIRTKKAVELNKDDDFLLVLKDGSNILSKNHKTVSRDLAWFMGLFVADGNYFYDTRDQWKNSHRGVQISFNKQEKQLIKKTKDVVKKLIGYDIKFILDPRYENSLRGYIYNSEFARVLENKYHLRKYHRLPEWIWSSTPDVIMSFIQGFFDGDGYTDGKEIHINDQQLAEELNLLIQLVGISTTYIVKENSQVIRIQHTLGRNAKGNKVIKDKLHNHIPEFLLDQKYVRVEGQLLYQSYGCKAVGLASIDRFDISNNKIEWLRNSDFAVVEIADITIEKLDYEQKFYDIELEKNHFFVHSQGNITHNCCRLRIDNTELRKRGGGLFGANPMTGSTGVVTLNMPRIGYLADNEKDFMKRVYHLMDLARESMETKRRILESLTEQGLYPYARFYLSSVKERFDEYWKNHFNTIGLNGMNEALINFMGKDIASSEGSEFAAKVMQLMKERMIQYQEETDNLYNLEATPAEGTAYRLARLDKQRFGNSIIAANEDRVKNNGAEPYYTNSTHLPVGYTDDIFTALELQDELQQQYTGGTVFHGFLGENMPGIESTKLMVKRIAENFSLPYYTITPTFSICPVHGYIPGEHEYCPKCKAEAEAAAAVEESQG